MSSRTKDELVDAKVVVSEYSHSSSRYVHGAMNEIGWDCMELDWAMIRFRLDGDKLGFSSCVQHRCFGPRISFPAAVSIAVIS